MTNRVITYIGNSEGVGNVLSHDLEKVNFTTPEYNSRTAFLPIIAYELNRNQPIMPSLTDIIDRIHSWMQGSHSGIPEGLEAARHQKLPWEGWAQVEVACAILNKYPGLDISREFEVVYEGTDTMSDVVIKEPNHNIIVELRCERASEDADSVLAGFTEDCDMIRAGRIKEQYRPADAVAVGICTNIATFEHVMEHCAYKIQGTKVGDFGLVWYSEHIA